MARKTDSSRYRSVIARLKLRHLRLIEAIVDAKGISAAAASLNISQPAVSKHMRILTECGLVDIVKQGRERHCSARLQALQEVEKWAAQYRIFWNNKLDKLEDLLWNNTES